MVVEVEPALASKLKVGDKVIKVDDELLNYKKFVDVVKNLPEHKLRVARLATAAASGPPLAEGLRHRQEAAPRVEADAPPPSAQAEAARPARGGQRDAGAARGAAREGGRSMKIGAVTTGRTTRSTSRSSSRGLVGADHETGPRLPPAPTPSPSAAPSSTSRPSPPQPIIKKVTRSMAEVAGLVPGDVVLSVNGISGLSNFQGTSPYWARGTASSTSSSSRGARSSSSSLRAQQPQG